MISSQDKLVRDLEEKIHENTFRPSTDPAAADTSSSAIHNTQEDKNISDSLIEEDLARLSHECKNLQEKVQRLEEDNANLQVEYLFKSVPTYKS